MRVKKVHLQVSPKVEHWAGWGTIMFRTWGAGPPKENERKKRERERERKRKRETLWLLLLKLVSRYTSAGHWSKGTLWCTRKLMRNWWWTRRVVLFVRVPRGLFARSQLNFRLTRHSSWVCLKRLFSLSLSISLHFSFSPPPPSTCDFLYWTGLSRTFSYSLSLLSLERSQLG